jgi:hypothetical protein
LNYTGSTACLAVVNSFSSLPPRQPAGGTIYAISENVTDSAFAGRSATWGRGERRVGRMRDQGNRPLSFLDEQCKCNCSPFVGNGGISLSSRVDSRRRIAVALFQGRFLSGNVSMLFRWQFCWASVSIGPAAAVLASLSHPFQSLWIETPRGRELHSRALCLRGGGWHRER